MKDFKLENDILVDEFLRSTFFESFSVDSPKIDNLRSIELQINSKCDLSCKYCYYTNFGQELYPNEISNGEQIKKNLLATLIWLHDNRMNPDLDIFTGEVFAQQIGRECLGIIMEFYSKVAPELRPARISVPTNYSFMLHPELIKFAERIISGFGKLGIRIGFSASFDGRMLDSDNRPMKNVIATGISDPRDDAYYDEIFRFNSHYNFGFHPMVYSNKIEKWKENFLWFQDQFEKHNIPWTNIYLLEVRNAEWTKQQIVDFSEFIRFLINFAWEKCDKDIDKYFKFLKEGRGFNMLAAPLSRVGRGIGCSVQSMMYLRLGDLTLSPCHRTMYPGFQTVKFKTVDDRIVGFESVNPELLIGVYGLDAATQPYCQDCALAPVCAKGCFGAQLEVMGDMFTPIPTVCELEFAKIYAMADEYRRLGILDVMLKDRGNIENAFKMTLRLMETASNKEENEDE